MEKSVEGSEKMEREGETFAKTLSPSGKHAIVVGLSGELGSGKTTFVKGMARALGVVQIVTSPTFVIEKIYPIGTDDRKRSTLGGADKLERQSFKHLVHIDAYRLESGKELSALGFNDLLRDPGNLILIEWPEHVEDIFPPDIKMLHFVFINDSTRFIKENGHGKD